MDKLKKVLVIFVVALSIVGVAINLPAEFNWWVSLSCLGGYLIAYLIIKEIYKCPTDDVLEVIGHVGAVTVMAAIAGLIPLVVIAYPVITTMIDIYGITLIWSIEITLVAILLHDGLPEGSLRWVIVSILVFWTGLCIAAIGISALQPILQVVMSGSIIVFTISFIIWGFKSIKSK